MHKNLQIVYTDRDKDIDRIWMINTAIIPQLTSNIFAHVSSDAHTMLKCDEL